MYGWDEETPGYQYKGHVFSFSGICGKLSAWGVVVQLFQNQRVVAMNTLYWEYGERTTFRPRRSELPCMCVRVTFPGQVMVDTFFFLCVWEWV